MQHDVPLAPLTTLRCGGHARRLETVDTTGDLIAAVAAADRRGEQVLILGEGSNVVIGDEGFDGTVVTVATRGCQIEQLEGEFSRRRVDVAAGELWDHVVARAVDAGLVGAEALSGIPGMAGAAPVQNIGAYGAELAQVLHSVIAYDRVAGDAVTFPADACGFGYRTSRFKREPGRWVITGIALELGADDPRGRVRHSGLAERLGLSVGDLAPVVEIRRAVLAVRREKGMVLDISDHDTWSVGSFFVNPVVAGDVAAGLPASAPRFPAPDDRVKLSAAWLIEAAGCPRGYSVRPGAPAALSSRHTLAITNRGSARTADILELARVVRAAVKESFGITLEPEPTLVDCSL